MITVDFQRLPLGPGDKILDIGCGPGRHVCEAVKYDGVLSVGADINADEAAAAREKLTLHRNMGLCNGQGEICVANITCLPFDDAAFDLVICTETLEHVADPQAAAIEVLRVLKPGKHLVVSVPRYWPEKMCWSLSKAYTQAEGGHIRIFTKRDLADLLINAGAIYRRRHYAHSLHTPFWWLKCLLGLSRTDCMPVNLYHRFLVWDMMKQPRVIRLLEKMLNPLLGKSLVLYFRKAVHA